MDSSFIEKRRGRDQDMKLEKSDTCNTQQGGKSTLIPNAEHGGEYVGIEQGGPI